MKQLIAAGVVVAGLAVAATQLTSAQAPKSASSMTFFITSAGPGKGADLGGLTGADAYCQKLAAAVGAGSHEWHAYLSTSAADGQKAINAKDRIGAGPWTNAKGVQIAANLADLHSENAKTGKEGSLNEKGEVVNGRGDNPNRHDIMTGSQVDGMAFPAGQDLTCKNWTSSAAEGSAAQVGHHDRQGGGEHPTSWNSAHASKGCSQDVLKSTGGDGLFYCFAVK